MCCACPSVPAPILPPPHSNSFPFFHPTAIPPWPHHPLFTTSSFPAQPKQARAIREPASIPAGKQSTDPPQSQHCRLGTAGGRGGRGCMRQQPGLCWLVSWEQGTVCRSSEARQSIGKTLGSSRSGGESAGVCRVSGREQGGKAVWRSPYSTGRRRWEQPYLHPSSLSTEGERTGERSDNS